MLSSVTLGVGSGGAGLGPGPGAGLFSYRDLDANVADEGPAVYLVANMLGILMCRDRLGGSVRDDGEGVVRGFFFLVKLWVRCCSSLGCAIRTSQRP